jgi:hypothetical protein
MALTQDQIDIIIDPALDRIAAGSATFSPQTDVVTLAVLRHYERTLKSTLRSLWWPWASDRATLLTVQTLVLDTMPTSAWSVGDTIAGASSGTTAEILTVTSPTEYVIIHRTGDFTAGETITNATIEKVYHDGVEVTYDDETVYWWDDSSASQVVCGSAYPVATDVEPNHEWTKKYPLPSDFIRLISVFEEDDVDWKDDRFVREGDFLLTNYTTANIQYVQYISDPNDFEDLFKELLILRLAVVLINPLAGSSSQKFKKELRDDLNNIERKVKSISLSENRVGGRNDWDEARWLG